MGYQNNQHEELIRLDESHAQVLQLQEVGHGELGHHHEVQSNDKVGHVGYQID